MSIHVRAHKQSRQCCTPCWGPSEHGSLATKTVSIFRHFVHLARNLVFLGLATSSPNIIRLFEELTIGAAGRGVWYADCTRRLDAACTHLLYAACTCLLHAACAPPVFGLYAAFVRLLFAPLGLIRSWQENVPLSAQHCAHFTCCGRAGGIRLPRARAVHAQCPRSARTVPARCPHGARWKNTYDRAYGVPPKRHSVTDRKHVS